MKRILPIVSSAVAVTGVILLGFNIFLEGRVNFTPPLVFLMLGGAFTILALTFSRQWIWANILYIPAMVLLALGIIFFLNVITNDWNSWAYAWLLILTGLGFGFVLTGRAMNWRKEFTLGGIGLIILGTSFFAIFGVIAGGKVIQIMAPVLLILGGLALRWLRPDAILPDRFARRFAPSPSVDNSTSEIAPLSSNSPVMQIPRADAPELVEPLSERELEVLRMIDLGLTNQEIAAQLVLAQSTVKTHINNIYGKLGVQTRTQAVKKSREMHII
jgi:DNA-binding CsgD family transcriptional regulator